MTDSKENKVLILSAVFPPEPVVSAKLSFDIANSISERNSVTVISPRPSRPLGFQFTNEKLFSKFEQIQVNSFIWPKSTMIGRFLESYSFGKHCYKHIGINHLNIKVIYANTWPLLAQYITIKAALKYQIPIIIHVQDIYPESLTNKLPIFGIILNLLLLPIDKYVLRNATKVIAISDKMRDYLVNTRKIDPEKVAVVQNWQDEEEFMNYIPSDRSQNTKGKSFIFMYLGNIGPVAGVDLLIDAFILADLKNCKLVIAGSGSMKEQLQKKVSDLNLNTIEFWPVPAGKVPEIQDQSDVLLLPIKKGAAVSSIPSKLPAYMFSAKPIIACVDKYCDTANAINSSECGWTLNPENIDELAKKMEFVSNLNKMKLRHMGKNGFNYAIENLSKKRNLLQLVTILNQTMPT